MPLDSSTNLPSGGLDGGSPGQLPLGPEEKGEVSEVLGDSMPRTRWQLQCRLLLLPRHRRQQSQFRKRMPG